ncbi:hypothetical protein Y032_0003g1477 [Ancylostoma ceylanicum]|uniref:Uncharacterized protein n=1 Tax=Ancylostoma ceylanicum TaxID=53326 RepID=A0A016VY48_9BILA|nr:hypothetical protein Y032_0003g1477 [Ancylostoma ceylanicum]
MLTASSAKKSRERSRTLIPGCPDTDSRGHHDPNVFIRGNRHATSTKPSRNAVGGHVAFRQPCRHAAASRLGCVAIAAAWIVGNKSICITWEL